MAVPLGVCPSHSEVRGKGLYKIKIKIAKSRFSRNFRVFLKLLNKIPIVICNFYASGRFVIIPFVGSRNMVVGSWFGFHGEFSMFVLLGGFFTLAPLALNHG